MDAGFGFRTIKNRTRQQEVDAGSGSLQRPANLNTPTLAGWIRTVPELKFRASLTTSPIEPLHRHKSGTGVIKPSGIRQQPTGQRHNRAIFLNRPGWIRRWRQRCNPEQTPQQQGQTEQQCAGLNGGETGQRASSR